MMKPSGKPSVSFIGTGNIAVHLAKGFGKAGIVTDSVWSPREESRNRFAGAVGCKAVHNILHLHPYSDFYIIAVPDDRIEEVVAKMPEVKGIVAHTSGITAMRAISARFDNSGVFYPLQTFSKDKAVDLSNVPFCIEGNNRQALTRLNNLAAAVSGNVFHIDSERRAKLHLTAVMVSNFVNYLYHTAEDILTDNGLPFEMLLPLINEVASKVGHLSPREAQTGPARRNDAKTIEKHHEMLDDYPEYKKIYQLITRQIIKHYHE
jgi:predicted short-subunit dehydrogenase-like oxidoreductase (DUF2520 family)